MKKDHKEVVLNYFSKQYSSNMRHFIYLFGLLENEARNTIENGWEKRLLWNMEYVRRKDRKLYNSVVAVAEKEFFDPDTANYTYAQDHTTANLKLIQEFDYQQTLHRLLEKLLEVQAKGDLHNVMLDLSSRLYEIINEIENPERYSRKTLEYEIRCHEMEIADKYKQIRKLKARSEIENTKGNLVNFTKRISK